MSYEYITKYDSPNFGYPRGTRGQNKPKKIVIHYWGVTGQSFLGVVNYLCRNGGNTSANYVVESGRVACIVNQSDAAWHSGTYYDNISSIGIECRPEMSKGDFDTVAQLIARIWKDQGKKLPLIGHKDVVATSCPGPYYPKLDELYKLAEHYYNGAKKPLNKVVHNRSKGKDNLTIAKEVLVGKWGNGEDRINGLKKAGYDPNKIQSIVNKICSVNEVVEKPKVKTVTELAKEVLSGNWGTGTERKRRLTDAGYDYNKVQAEVNRICGVSSTQVKSIDVIASEVIAGKWGNGSERKANLEKAGYSYGKVQAKVNELLS